MTGPPKRRRARRGEAPDPSEDISLGSDESDHTLDLLVSQLLPRPVRRDELRELRRLWWAHAREGHRLPAEAGIIAIEGGRP